MIWFVIILGWLVCAILAAGYSYAYSQKKWPRLSYQHRYMDLSASWGFSIFGGPFALIIDFFGCEFFRFGFLNPFKINGGK
jgi:hypothetical protein